MRRILLPCLVSTWMLAAAPETPLRAQFVSGPMGNEALETVRCVAALKPGPLRASPPVTATTPLGDLLQARTEGDLAMFIHERITRETPIRELLRGLNATQTIKLPCFTAAIPVKEIYGTIVQTRFDRQLGASFWARGFSYNVREICSFRDAQGELVRYSIFIFDDQQYREMKALLNRKTAKTGG